MSGKRDGGGRWRTGVSGNPTGKLKGTRSRLSRAYVADLAKVYSKRGFKALDNLAQDDPEAFLRLVAALVPRDLKVAVGGDNGFVAALQALSRSIHAERRTQDAQLDARTVGSGVIRVNGIAGPMVTIEPEAIVALPAATSDP